MMFNILIITLSKRSLSLRLRCPVSYKYDSGSATKKSFQHRALSTATKRQIIRRKVLVKKESGVTVEAAVADHFRYFFQRILENPGMKKLMEELQLRPEEVEVPYPVVAIAEDQVMIRMVVEAKELEELLKRPRSKEFSLKTWRRWT